MKEIDCEDTSEVVCPYCGHEHSDSWEIVADGTVVTVCDKCDMFLKVTAYTTVEYSSSKVPCLNKETDHDWSSWSVHSRMADGINKERRYCYFCDKEEYRVSDPMACPKCGRKMTRQLDSICTSMPPQVRIDCECGHTAFSFL